MLERELFSVLEGTADAAYAIDEQGLVRSWNRAAEKLFGYVAAEVIDKPCAELFQGHDAFGTQICTEHCNVIECAKHHLETPNYDLEVETRAGGKIWVNISILVFHDERANRNLVVHMARDITERKRQEQLTRKLLEIAKDVSALADDGEALAPVSPLTEAELNVLRLLASGKGPARVAQELKITPSTMRNHIHHVNQKLHTRNRLEAVMQASRRKLI
jgi:PAS domain S-box-containing protein